VRRKTLGRRRTIDLEVTLGVSFVEARERRGGEIRPIFPGGESRREAEAQEGTDV
jgi:hypothetical protein